jgi:hypothetical protein
MRDLYPVQLRWPSGRPAEPPAPIQTAARALWLSLSVDPDRPLPRPNLDFKIETGDSLTGLDPSQAAESGDTGGMWKMQRWWHASKHLAVPANLTLLPLPPYSPELNPVERVWRYLRQTYLSNRLFGDYNEIFVETTAAWNRLDEARLASITATRWLRAS